jgi:tetratricopeptide (TPR) repeat protein
MSNKISVFVSSKMAELRAERDLLIQLLPQLGGENYQIQPWIFESDANASNNSIRQVYLEALERSDLYIGIFWQEYGDIYVKNVDARNRDPRLTKFLEKESDVRFGITPVWYTTLDEFRNHVTRSTQQWLENRRIAYHTTTNAIIATMSDDIPDLPRRLIGRKSLLKKVRNLLDDNEQVLLRGFGGMGKTAIAATVAAEYIDDGAGEVIWIQAGAVEPEGIFDAIGRAFDRQQEVLAADGEKQVQIVRRILGEFKGLLVLDDAWNGNALARIMKAIPRKMPVLVTSRQRFPLDEVIEIGRLDAQEALSLLNYHARNEDAADEDASALCNLLGNHPFALEIAGKTLKVYDLTPAELLKRIQEAPHDLHMPTGFGELGREGIKALLDASIDALTKPLYETYIAMGGLFEPTGTAEMVSRVMQQPIETVQDSLQQLVQRGLINEREQGGVDYFHQHDLGYSYARSLFNNQYSNQQKVLQACHEYVLAHVQDLPQLDVEYNSILEAAEMAFQNQQYGVLVDIIKTLAVDGTYFAARGHTLRSLRLMQAAIDRALEADEKLIAHHLLSKFGNAYAQFIGNLDEALKHYQRALQLAEELGDTQREAILLTVIGTVRFRQGASDSDNYHQLAEAIAREQQDDIVLCQVLSNRGAQAIDDKNPTPDYQLGKQLSEEAARLAKANQLHHLYFYALLNGGSAEHELRAYADALLTHQFAYDFAHTQHNYLWMAEAQVSLGEDYHKLGKSTEAQERFTDAIRLFNECGANARADSLMRYMREHQYVI